MVEPLNPEEEEVAAEDEYLEDSDDVNGCVAVREIVCWRHCGP